MKLLLDQNVSYRVLRGLPEIFKGSKSLAELGFKDEDDELIWSFARLEGFTILTQDADFHDILTRRGFPPKIIWLRLGNRTVLQTISILQFHQKRIAAFIQESETGILEIARAGDHE